MFLKYLICFNLFLIIQSFKFDYENFVESIQGLIPDQLIEIPESKLTVIYNNEELVPGEELTPYEVRNQPTLTWHCDPDKYYHLIMYDADAPSRNNQSLSDFKHWLVVNIPGMDLDKGDVITGYGGGLPQYSTGLHRYVFLLFEKPYKTVFNEPRTGNNSIRNRGKFDLINFCRKYKFDDVYAANYFVSEWEPYVDEVMKQSKFITN